MTLPTDQQVQTSEQLLLAISDGSLRCLSECGFFRSFILEVNPVKVPQVGCQPEEDRKPDADQTDRRNQGIEQTIVATATAVIVEWITLYTK